MSSLTFDVALHMGTLVAVLFYFRHDWVSLVGGFFRRLGSRRLADPGAKMSWLVIAGTIPAAVIGLLLESKIESAFRNPMQIAVVMVLFSLVFVAAERTARQVKTTASLT